MNLLLIDTSGPTAGVGIVRDGEILWDKWELSGKNHSESILPMVEEGLNGCGLTPMDVDFFACVTGPGSFTGVRIGVSLVKGMAHGVNPEKPNCLGVDALEAMAAAFPEQEDCLLCPIQDARAGQVYGAAFLPGMPPRRVLPDMAIALPDFLALCREKAQGRPLFLTGDGVRPNLALLEGLEDVRLSGEDRRHLQPGAAALLAWNRLDTKMDCFALMPVYLRPPQAERLRDRLARQAGGKA